MALRRALLMLLSCAFVACATVASLEVTNEPPQTPEMDDKDDPNRPPDAAADAAADAASDSGLAVDAADARPAPAPSTCSCPMEQGCCANGSTNTCTPVSGADACRTNGGLFLRCSGSDLANGRTCCFTSDNKGTFYGSSCEDAGAQVCSDQTDCDKGTCTALAAPCRGVSLKACFINGGTLPVCP